MPIYTGNKSTATYVQSNFGGTVGDTTDIGTWGVDNGAHSMRVSVVAAISGHSVCKNYEISVQFGQTGGAFHRVLPVSASGSYGCLLYTSPSPRDRQKSRMPSSA